MELFYTLFDIKVNFREFGKKQHEEEDIFFSILDYADGSVETSCPKPCLETWVE